MFTIVKESEMTDVSKFHSYSNITLEIVRAVLTIVNRH